MFSHLRPAVIMLLFFTLVTGLAYPLAITGIAQAVFPVTANGSMVRTGNAIVGSGLIGQNWMADRYFHGRPSAAGNGYDALASSGSNLGATSAKLADRVRGEVENLRASGITVIPADAVTASASGLDPHVSPATAIMQVPRVAKARNIKESQVIDAVNAATESRSGILGEPRVNVLLLNMALDRLSSPGNG